MLKISVIIAVMNEIFVKILTLLHKVFNILHGIYGFLCIAGKCSDIYPAQNKFRAVVIRRAFFGSDEYEIVLH